MSLGKILMGAAAAGAIAHQLYGDVAPKDPVHASTGPSGVENITFSEASLDAFARLATVPVASTPPQDPVSLFQPRPRPAP